MDRGSVGRLLQPLIKNGWAAVTGRVNHRQIVATVPPAVQEAMADRLKERRTMMNHAGEGLSKEMLNIIVDDDNFIDNARPWFLQNQGTFQFLEYDRLYPKRNVATEYGGWQHYAMTDFTDETDLAQIRARDELKAKISQDRGIVLVTFTEDDLTLEGMLAKLPPQLPRAHVDPGDLYVRTLLDLCGEYVANCKRFRARDQARLQKKGDRNRVV